MMVELLVELIVDMDIVKVLRYCLFSLSYLLLSVSVWLGLAATMITASRSPDSKTRILYVKGIFGIKVLATVRKRESSPDLGC